MRVELPSPEEASPRDVLVVNSDPVTRARIGALLSDAGFDVISCASGAEALAVLGVAPRSAVVVGSRLSDMGGIQFVQACLSASLSPATVMTGRAGEIRAAVEAMREGIRDYLPEPFDARLPQALKRALREVQAPHHDGLQPPAPRALRRAGADDEGDVP